MSRGTSWDGDTFFQFSAHLSCSQMPLQAVAKKRLWASQSRQQSQPHSKQLFPRAVPHLGEQNSPHSCREMLEPWRLKISVVLS